MGNNLYLATLAFEQLIYRKASNPLGNGKNSGAESLAVRSSAGQQAKCPFSLLCRLAMDQSQGPLRSGHLGLRLPGRFSGGEVWAACRGPQDSVLMNTQL